MCMCMYARVHARTYECLGEGASVVERWDFDAYIQLGLVHITWGKLQL